MKHRISRRAFLSAAAAAPAAAAVAQTVSGEPPPTRSQPGAGNWVRWLDGKAPPQFAGTPGARHGRAASSAKRSFAIRGAGNTIHALQSGRSPGGRMARSSGRRMPSPPRRVSATDPSKSSRSVATRRPQPLLVNDRESGIEIDTGRFICRLARSGTHFITSISARRPRSPARRTPRAAAPGSRRVHRRCAGHAGELREHDRENHARTARPRPRGRQGRRHTCEGHRRTRAGCRSRCACISTPAATRVRVLHTIVFDGDESRDFIRGLGLRFTVPMDAELHDRHVRFMGEERWRVRRGGARPDRACAATRAAAARNAQIAGQAAPSITPVVSEPAAIHSGVRRLDAVPAERGLLHDPQAHRRRPCLARQRAAARAPAASGTSAPPRAASRSASAISGRAIRRSSTSAMRHTRRGERHDVGVGARCAADGPALLS